MAMQDPWALNDGPSLVQELVSGVIDYVSMRAAMELKPDLIRGQLTACGNCPERAALEQSLANAERDRQMIASLESLIAESRGMDPWTAWKLGIKIRPAEVLKQPAPCIALYDRAYGCMVEHDDRSGNLLGRACHAEYRLHRLCAAGQARPFNEYVDFLRKKKQGELLSETEDDRTVYFYNVKPQMTFPQQVISAEQSQYFYNVVTDSTQPGTLRTLMISGVPLAGPSLRFANQELFDQPWRTIIHEDNVAIPATARTIECQYVLPGTNLVRAYLFWYRERPARAEPSYLNSRMTHHPLLRVGAPVNECPIKAEQAEAMLPLIRDDTLKARYAAMLVQPGKPGQVTPATNRSQGNQDAAAERARARERARQQ